MYKLILVQISILGYVFSSADNLIIKDSNFLAEIKRDQWGVPHIYGKRDADVSLA